MGAGVVIFVLVADNNDHKKGYTTHMMKLSGSINSLSNVFQARKEHNA